MILVLLVLLVTISVLVLTQTERIATLLSSFSGTGSDQSAPSSLSPLSPAQRFKNPLAGYLDSCLSNQLGAGNCGTRLRLATATSLVTEKIPSSSNLSEVQSQTALSLYLAKKGATWRTFLPEISTTQITPKTAYIQFYQDVSYAATTESIDLGLLAAYYERLFSTLEQPSLQTYKASMVPVPPIPFAQRYKFLLKAYSSPNSTFALESQTQLQALDWSPQAKALVATSMEFLDPAVVKAMFAEEGSLSQTYTQFLAALPANTTYGLTISDQDLTSDEFFGQPYKQITANDSVPKLALCKQQTGFLCQIDTSGSQIQCTHAPYWSSFCVAIKFYTPIKVDEVGPE